MLAEKISSQYWFYRERLVAEGYDDLTLVVVSDLLSGDTEAKRVSLQVLESLRSMQDSQEFVGWKRLALVDGSLRQESVLRPVE